MKHYPMTNEQREVLDQDLATIMKNLGSIANLLKACYGDMDHSVARAEEATAAMQRLVWALERQHQLVTDKSQTHSAHVQRQSAVSAIASFQGKIPEKPRRLSER